MDKHTLRVLEFDKVLQMAAAFAVTSPGSEVVRNMRPLNNIEEARQQIELVSECRWMLSEDRLLPIEHFEDLKPLFHKVRPADAVLQPFELTGFLPLFNSALGLSAMNSHDSYPTLCSRLSELITHWDIKKAIDISIDREGRILDNASPELSRIRKNIKSIDKNIKTILEGMLKNKELSRYLQDYFLAERIKRWVIPVKKDFKGRVPGVVHDISNTGETVYVEPFSIQNLGNELESLRAEEKLEEYRVLKILSALLRANLKEIEEDHQIVAETDALQAIAVFADRMEMSPPELNEKGYLKINKGRHPLLWKTLKKTGSEKDIMPLDMEMGRGYSCMVITGSNAGGKTVALKTAGVIILMALSGMHVPSESGTTVCFLEKLLADIGDEQSIEQNLSTFSAHIKRISSIINEGGRNTLIIIDELGTGTDPGQGGALSCAVLRRLNKEGALSIVSTHLGMLKAFAHSEPEAVNSAMEMEEVDIEGIPSFRPTYKLVTGEPGTSHAFEIAESLGLQEYVINEAREFISGEDAQIESLISELKRKDRDADSRLKDAENLRREVHEMRSSLDKETAELKLKKKEALSQALDEAEGIIRKARQEAGDLIETVKKSGLKEGRQAVREMGKRQAELKKIKERLAPDKRVPLKEVEAGQTVFVNSLGTEGAVRSINNKVKKCKVLVNEKEVTLSIKDLSMPLPIVSKEEGTESKSEGTFVSKYRINDIDIPAELNVIGKRVDPALSLIERYLNDVSLTGLKEVKIIHGMGTGILAGAIREYLEDHPLVESSRRGDENEGGGGVTIVFL